MVIYILIGIAVLVGLGMVVSREFRSKVLQLLRITSNNALDKATTAHARNKDRLKQLQSQLPAKRERVAHVMSLASKKQRELNTATQQRDKLKSEYLTAKSMTASEETLSAIAQQYSAAKERVTSLEQQLQESKNQSVEAQKSLDDVITELQSMAHMVEDQAGKAELAEAYRDSAKTRQEINDMKSGIGDMSDDFKATDQALDEARNLDELSQGSKTDRERENIARKSKSDQARADLEADLDK